MTFHAKLPLASQASGVLVPALHSLKGRHVALALAALPNLGPGWSLDIEDDYDGDRAIIISRQVGNADDPTFVLYGGGDAVHLSKVVRETWECLGHFSQIETAMHVLETAYSACCVPAR